MRKPNRMYTVFSTAGNGHWRSGKFWSPDGTTINEVEVTKQMYDDPRLRIVKVGVKSDAE